MLLIYTLFVTGLYADTNESLLDSLFAAYKNTDSYTMEFTIHNGEVSHPYSGDSVHVTLSQKGDSIYFNQGSFEVLQDGQYLVFVNHMFRTISYARLDSLENNPAANLPNGPVDAFSMLMKDTTSVQITEMSGGKKVTFHLNVDAPKIYFHKIEIYFAANGALSKAVYFQKKSDKTITYHYKSFLTGTQVDQSIFNRGRYFTGGQVSPNYSTYTLEKM